MNLETLLRLKAQQNRIERTGLDILKEIKDMALDLTKLTAAVADLKTKVDGLIKARHSDADMAAVQAQVDALEKTLADEAAVVAAETAAAEAVHAAPAAPPDQPPPAPEAAPAHA